MKKYTRIRLQAFLQKHATDQPILDIGAGGTEYSATFPNRTTLDIDAERHPDVVANAESMPFEDDAYDVILCSEVFEHLQNPQKVISEIRRVLKPGGKLILTTRFLFPIHDAPHDYFRFTPYGLRYLFQEWNIEDMEAEADSFSTIAILLQRVMLQTTPRGGKATKLLLHIISRFFLVLSPLAKQEYGDISRTRLEPLFMTSGIYMVCRNTKPTELIGT